MWQRTIHAAPFFWQFVNSEAGGATWGRCAAGGAGACWAISHLCWSWPWGKTALIVNTFPLSIWKLTLDLGKDARNWFLTHIWRVFSPEFNKNYNCSPPRAVIQRTALDPRDRKTLQSIVLIIPRKCQFFSKHPALCTCRSLCLQWTRIYQKLPAL